jgi:7,8-dihydroneopterin aldolase/epimerase/oxygenase
MCSHFRISLEDLQFHAPHGVYEGEARTGNAFVVDVVMQVDGQNPVQHLDETVNYVRAYELVRGVMTGQEALLEALCQRIAAELEAAFTQLQQLEVRIRKLTPAIARFSGSVSVSYSKSYTPGP